MGSIVKPQLQNGSKQMPLKDSLRDALDWSQYEAAAYTALVENGPMEASDISLIADIPDSRVYNVLSSLEEKGCVLKKDRRPAIYDAQHPRYVIQEQREKFIEKSNDVEAKLENAWESERGDDVEHTQEPWVLSSASGTVAQIRRLLREAEESIQFVDSNLRWISRRKDLEILRELADNDVEIQIIGPSETALDDLRDLENADLRYYDGLKKSYYVVDEKEVVMRLNSGNTGIVFSDEASASVFVKDFEEIIEESTQVEDIAA